MKRRGIVFSQKSRSNSSSSFQMTERDFAILTAVSHYVRLDRRLVETLLFSRPEKRRASSSRAATRLRLLWQQGLLKRISRPINPSYGSQGFVYQLSLKGAQLLQEQCSMQLSDLCYSNKAKLHPMSVDHGLAVAEVSIALEQAAAKHDFVVEQAQNEVQLKRAGWDRVTVTFEKGKSRKVPVTPDGYFALSTPRGRWHFYLEVDRSTETVSQIWQRKILAYKEYVLSGKFHKRYGLTWPETPLRILTVAPSLERIQNLKSAAERYGSPEVSRMFLFAVMREVTASDPFAVSIWLRAGDSRRFVLLKS